MNSMLLKSLSLKHYKRQDIQKAIVESCTDREVGVFYKEAETYGKRPDTLNYPADVIEFVKKGATSFHISEERWTDPLRIVTGMSKKELDSLRKGWDLVLDIDCPWLEYSQMAAHVIIEKLKSLGMNGFSVKFSGNHGFHIGVPFEAFPQAVHFEGKVQEVRTLFPEGPRKIAAYLQDEIRKPLGKMLLEKHTLAGIMKRTGKQHNELVKSIDGQKYLDPFSLLTIDTVLIASRHLVRAPYSLNEKSGLASIPVDPDSIINFDKSSATPDKVVPGKAFLDRKIVKPGEARLLFENAFSHKLSTPLQQDSEDVNKQLRRKEEDFQIPSEAIPESAFPPCMQQLAKGIKDGKKRAMFAAANFLVHAGWTYEKIEEWITAFSKNSQEPLREVIIKGHIKHHRTLKEKLMPPNCRKYYEDIGICQPDAFCGRIKNPVMYSILKAKADGEAREKQQNAELRKRTRSKKAKPAEKQADTQQA